MNTQFNSYKIIGLMISLGTLSAFPVYHFLTEKSGPKLQLFGNLTSQTQVIQTVRKIAKQGSSVIDTLHEQLNAEHAHLLAELQKAFPNAQWPEMLETLKTIIENDQLLSDNPSVKNSPSDDPLIKKIREILASYGIDPKKVIIEFDDTLQSFAASQGYFNKTIKHFIKVNLQEVLKLPADVQEAFLRHEIIHLLNYDALYMLFIKDILEKSGIDKKEYSQNPAFIAYKKHKEYRADLLATASNPDSAQSFIADFERIIALYPQQQTNPTHTTHPTETQRCKAVTQLANYLEAEKQIVSA